jgi:glycosyltransferase involved in cell wall biosynthesis
MTLMSAGSASAARGDRPRLLFVVTEDWYFVSHRLGLAMTAARAGYEVAVATRLGREAGRLASSGLTVIPLTQMSRGGGNPWREIRAIVELVRVYRAWRPDIVHHVAFKPVIYGGIAASLAGVRVRVNALAGLGFMFSSASARARLFRLLARPLLAFVLRGGHGRVILQNPDDFSALSSSGVIDRADVRLIRGAGVDTERFAAVPLPPGRPVVVLASRMLWSKGVGDFVAAARSLRAAGVDACFALVGESDAGNPAAVPEYQLEEWRRSGDVEWWGRRDDMPQVFGAAAIVCLPSTYGEGVPKALIEAASCGRPLVAYDVPGSREIVRDGQNGILVPPGDVVAFAAAVGRLLADAALRAAMGERARQIALGEFSDAIVQAATLDVYREVLTP